MTITNEQREKVLDLLPRLSAAMLLGAKGELYDKAIATAGLTPEIIQHIINTPFPAETKPDDLDWLENTREDLFLDEPLSQEQKKRMFSVLHSVPEWDRYAAFVRSYSGKWPSGPRPNHENENIHTKIDPEFIAPMITELKQSVLNFMLEDSRMEYIQTGKSDLTSQLCETTTNWLQENAQVYVLADLDRFTDGELICLDPPHNDILLDIILWRAQQIKRHLRKINQGAQGTAYWIEREHGHYAACSSCGNTKNADDHGEYPVHCPGCGKEMIDTLIAND